MTQSIKETFEIRRIKKYLTHKPIALFSLCTSKFIILINFNNNPIVFIVVIIINGAEFNEF